ncbi:MAG: alpha/beta fold hydrolase [Sandaracinaceae bacterium]|nr:alpha/beta fold hydrolase [Sandaracinaceae bacterium]
MELPRRCFLGAAVRDGDEGVEIQRVWPGSMAERAGAEPGDRIEAFGEPVATVAELVDAARAHAGADLGLRLVRDGEPRDVEVAYVPFPAEAVPGARVTYGASAGLRTIHVEPDGGADVVVVILPGIDRESVDYALREAHPAARFVADLAAGGVATLRVERPGLGDSPGPPSAGFLDEQRAYRDALADLGEARPLVLFGHSVGGMHAPMLADLADGLIVYGTSSRRWSECLRASRDRQLRLRNAAPVEGPVAWPPGRPARFHEELDAVDLRAAWAAVDAPVLVVMGEHDWVVGDEEPRELPGEVRWLDGLDHAFTRHASNEESLAQYGRGSYDERVARACVDWLRARDARR